jgi:hypothetical protein
MVEYPTLICNAVLVSTHGGRCNVASTWGCLWACAQGSSDPQDCLCSVVNYILCVFAMASDGSRKCAVPERLLHTCVLLDTQHAMSEGIMLQPYVL